MAEAFVRSTDRYSARCPPASTGPADPPGEMRFAGCLPRCGSAVGFLYSLATSAFPVERLRACVAVHASTTGEDAGRRVAGKMPAQPTAGTEPGRYGLRPPRCKGGAPAGCKRPQASAGQRRRQEHEAATSDNRTGRASRHPGVDSARRGTLLAGASRAGGRLLRRRQPPLLGRDKFFNPVSKKNHSYLIVILNGREGENSGYFRNNVLF